MTPDAPIPADTPLRAYLHTDQEPTGRRLVAGPGLNRPPTRPRLAARIGARLYTHAFTVDYRERHNPGHRGWIDRGWWVHGTPRLIPACRIRGHRPVVDGVDFREGYRSRWVCCDRCGMRVDSPYIPQDVPVGYQYSGFVAISESAERGVIGGHVKIGACHPGISAQLKVGHRASEHTLAAHLHLDRLLWLSLHTEGHGLGLVRKLNPAGYDSRILEVGVRRGRIVWELWAKRDHWSAADPWWMHGSVYVLPRRWRVRQWRESWARILTGRSL